MRTKSKTLVCLLLALVMLLSLAGLGILSFADDVVGKQATADASAFDGNGWYTQDAYKALTDKTYALREGAALVGQPGDGYLGYVAPEAAQGYTEFASFAEGKIMNNTKFDVTKTINFEIGIMAGNDHSWRMFNLYDSDSVGTKYYASTESNTPFGILIQNNADKAEVYINGTKQTLANEVDVMELNTEKTIKLTQATYILHYVSIDIGTDKTSIYIDDVLLGEFENITQASFPSGTANAVMHFSGGGGSPYVAMNHFDPFVVSSASTLGSINVKTFEDDLTIGLSKPVSEVKVNATGGDIVLEKGTDYTVDGNKITITNEFLTEKAEGYFDVNTVFTFTSDEDPARTTTLNYTVLYYNPPVYNQKETTIVKEALTEDVTFAVQYENENETYGMKVNGEVLAAENYSATWANNTITVTLKKEYLNSLTHGAYTFELTTLAGSVTHVVYRNEKDAEWITMNNGTTSDESEESAVANDNGSTTLNIGFLGNVYYSESLDVSKTIYLELDMNKVISDKNPHGWFAIGFTNDITKVTSLNEANSDDRLTFLYGHAKGEFQCAGVLANALIKPEYVNQNGPQLFALTFAEADQDGNTVDGQMTTLYFNGYKIFETDTKNQATFEKGCFLGMFSAIDVLNITTRTNPASPAANTYGLEYTLGTNTDVSFPMYNTTAVTAVKYGGKTLAANTDYTFADGKLTIKGSYLQTIAYADMMRFTVVADGAELKANVKALCEVSADKSAVTAVGENGAVFENAFGGKTVTSVVDMDTLETLTASQFTFADGKLTISKDYFTENKTYSFAVVTDDSLYFAMAIAEDYENGWAQKSGSGTGTNKDGLFSVKGEGNYLSEQLIDLTAGEIGYTLTIDKLNGYYLNGQTGSSSAHVAVYLYDLYSGNTLTFEIHANVDPASAEEGAYLGYIVLTVRDKNGNSVYVNNTAIADSTNFHDGSVIGENTVGFRYENNSLVASLNGTDYYFNGIGNTVLTDLRMGVSTTADVNGEQNAFSIKEKTAGEDPVNPSEPVKTGCGGSLSFGSVIGAFVLLAGAAAVTVKKKKKDKASGQDE